MSANRLLRRGVLIVVLLAAVVGVVPASPSSPVAAQSSGLGAGGEYHPLTPTRILDTREAPPLDVAPRGKKATSTGGSAFSFPVLGKGGVPAAADDVLAVVLSVVVVDPSAQGNLTLYPKGANAGTSSLVNFLPGRNVPNVAIVGVGDVGNVTAKLTTVASGRAHVAVDVFGWISTSSADERGARVVAVTPGRIFDSREQGGARGTKSSTALQIRGAVARDANYNPTGQIVPNSTSVTGVIVNITGINNLSNSGRTYMSMSPQRVPASAPGAPTSNVNVIPGQVKPVMAIVPVNSQGQVHLYNFRGPAHVAVDVLGYLQIPTDAMTTAGRIVPLESPFRVFDTREAAYGNVPLGTRQAENWSFKAFANSVRLNGTPVGTQAALFGNLTGTRLQRRVAWQPVSTYLSMYPGGKPRPFISNINVPEKESVPNMALISYGAVKNASGVIDPYVAQAFNYNGSLHYLLDVFGVVLK